MNTSLQSIIEVLNRDANPLQQHAQKVKHSLPLSIINQMPS